MDVSLQAYVVQVRRVLWIALVINLAVVAAKLAIGLSASSLAVLSDAAHSLVDGLNNIMGLMVMRLVRPYADEDHPYGHAKYEVIGALGVAVFMTITVFEIVTTAIERLISGGAPARITAITIIAFALTLIGNLLVIWYERTQGMRLKSQFLLADVRHTVSDLYITVSIIIGLTLVAAGYPIMDTLASLAVAAIVAYTAYGVVRDALPVLVDQAIYQPREIRKVVTEVEGVRRVEEVRTRGAGPGCFIELTIGVGEATLREAHAVADHVEQTLHERFGPDCTVTVHIEPEE